MRFKYLFTLVVFSVTQGAFLVLQNSVCHAELENPFEITTDDIEISEDALGGIVLDEETLRAIEALVERDRQVQFEPPPPFFPDGILEHVPFSDPNADDDGDGYSNSEEEALGSDPGNSADPSGYGD